jgi:hypothetical protein
VEVAYKYVHEKEPAVFTTDPPFFVRSKRNRLLASFSAHQLKQQCSTPN